MYKTTHPRSYLLPPSQYHPGSLDASCNLVRMELQLSRPHLLQLTILEPERSACSRQDLRFHHILLQLSAESGLHVAHARDFLRSFDRQAGLVPNRIIQPGVCVSDKSASSELPSEFILAYTAASSRIPTGFSTRRCSIIWPL